LTNLVQQWKLAEPPARAGLVTSHFRNLFHAEDSVPPAGVDLLPLLRPRLCDRETIESATFLLITRPVAFDLEEVLSVDLPPSVVNLKPEQAEATGLPTHELWEIARAQIDDGAPVDQQRMGAGLSV
jgi:hypothetical protein